MEEHSHDTGVSTNNELLEDLSTNSEVGSNVRNQPTTEVGNSMTTQVSTTAEENDLRNIPGPSRLANANPPTVPSPLVPQSSNSNSAIRQFKTRVDENGEVTYIFDSDCDSGDSEDEGTVVVAMRGPGSYPQHSSLNHLSNSPSESASSGNSGSNQSSRSNPFTLSRSSSMSMLFSSSLSGTSDESDDSLSHSVSLPSLPPVPPEARGGILDAIDSVIQRFSQVPSNVGGDNPNQPISSDEDDQDYVPGAARRIPARQRRRRRVQGVRRRRPRRKANPNPNRPKRKPRPLLPKTITRHIDDYTSAEDKTRFETLIAECQYRCTLTFREEDKDEEENSPDNFLLGSIEVGVIPPELQELPSFTLKSIEEEIPGIQAIGLHISEETNKSVMFIETKTHLTDDECKQVKLSTIKKNIELRRKYYYVDIKKRYYQLDLYGIPHVVLAGLGMKKYFRLEVAAFDKESKLLKLNAILNNSAVLPQHEIVSSPIRNMKILAEVVHHFLGISNVANDNEDRAAGMQGKEDIEWFYEQIKKYHREEILCEADVLHESLIPKLRDYQKNAVKWMLQREGISDIDEKECFNKINLAELFMSKMYKEVDLKPCKCRTNFLADEDESVRAYYNPYFGTFAWELPTVCGVTSGGILCDEMGLGKTVEVLALILLNQRTDLPTSNHESKDIAFISEENQKSNEECSFDNSSASCTTPVVRKRRRKGKAWGGRAKRNKTVPKVIKSPETGEIKVSEVSLKSPTKRKCREPSPCEFETSKVETNEENTVVLTSTLIEDKGQPRKRTVKKKVRLSEAAEKTPTLYEKIKVVYDNALSQYSESSTLTKRFNGKFFDPNIDVTPSFACVCGDGIEDNTKPIVTCEVCSTSQHADCVGFELTKNMAVVDYLCPHCINSQAPIDVKTTLIITPTTISHQWIQEIQKHVQNARLKILFYKGVSAHGYVPPMKLAQYDIIITTYNILASELNYVDLPHCSSVKSRQFRNAKRYLTTPSPLLSIYFWRICLDEAQMVEGTTTKVAAMALRLSSVHKWCVTGTPLNKGLEDLYGLFSFLEISPVNTEFWWKALISKSFYDKENSETLFQLFGQLIWRTCKKDVLSQLGVPAQSEIIHWTKFTPLETHFYKRQFEVCSDKILEKINDPRQYSNGNNFLTKKLAQLDRGTLNGLIQPFLVLRQACVHPQMVKGNFISLDKLKGTLTMEDLLDQLIKKSTLQCTDDNRLIISSLNAMAGLYLIQKNYLEAANRYREVLEQEAKHKDTFKTDSLQMVHTLENLADVLDGNYTGVGYTLRDDFLRSEANEIKTKYLESYAAEVKSARNVIVPVTQSIIELELKISGRKQSWWVATLDLAEAYKKDDELVSRVKDDLTNKSSKKKIVVGSIVNQFKHLSGLQHILVGKLVELESLRDAVDASLKDLEKRDPQLLVDDAVLCHLRKPERFGSTFYNDNSGGFKCTLCSYHDKFLEYESALFKEEKIDKITRTGRNYQKVKLAGRSLDQLTQDELDMVLVQEQEELIESTEHASLKSILRHGTWGPSETEKVLKILLGFIRFNGGSKRNIDDGTNHIKLLDAQKKEFKLNRILWRKLYDQVSALDELKQARTRLRLETPAEAKYQNATPSTSRRKATVPHKLQNTLGYGNDDRIQNINVLKPHEVEMKMHQAQLDYATGKQDLAVHMGQIIYLDTLKKNGYGKKGTTNSDDCAICCNQLGHEWCVLLCGHSFCNDCVRTMCPNPSKSLQCPMCRITTNYRDISFVDTKVSPAEEEEPDEPQPSTSKGLPAKGLNKVELQKPIKGSHSSKVEIVLETLFKLQISHPREKVIIFSSWIEVLEIISRALEQNDIKFCLLTVGKAFHKSLNSFKSREDIQVLLMPMSAGSKGLNIIEATHVFLIEPTLNLANELQAIGRVHRIGQTKSTFVHRFYVKQTIEEQLYEILKTQDVSSDEEGSLTVADLKNLITK